MGYSNAYANPIGVGRNHVKFNDYSGSARRRAKGGWDSERWFELRIILGRNMVGSIYEI